VVLSHGPGFFPLAILSINTLFVRLHFWFGSTHFSEILLRANIRFSLNSWRPSPHSQYAPQSLDLVQRISEGGFVSHPSGGSSTARMMIFPAPSLWFRYASRSCLLHCQNLLEQRGSIPALPAAGTVGLYLAALAAPVLRRVGFPSMPGFSPGRWILDCGEVRPHGVLTLGLFFVCVAGLSLCRRPTIDAFVSCEVPFRGRRPF